MKSMNFEFLRPDNDVLANLGGLAEAVLHIDPGSALTRLRSFAEELTKTIYKEERLPRLPQSSFYELIASPVFEACVNKSLIHQINLLRIKGNDTAHGAEGELRNAQIALGTAYQLAMYMGIKYYRKQRNQIPAFSDIEDPSAALAKLKKSVSSYEKELKQQQDALQQVMDQLERERTKNIEKLEPPAKPDQEKRKQQSQQVADSLQWNEAKTRALLIDAMLIQAGWDVQNSEQVGLEFEVPFPDNPSGKGYVDYVLWGDNGRPLAVIEAKRSGNTNLQAGREQARLYADALEQRYEQRPVIFYSNGYETFIWDDHQYNTYRPVYGFYSKDSLDYLIYQRHYRTAELEKFNPNLNIADRPYQIEAINNEPPYLVPFKVRDLTTDFLRDGIHYSNLSDEQKRQQGTGDSYAIGSTQTSDSGLKITERAVTIAGASEAMMYRRRLKDILDNMIAANPTLQKIRNGEAIAEHELKTLTSTILTTHPGVSLDVLNEFYGRTAEQLHVTVRELVGLDAHAHPKLTAQQVRFMNLLKNHIAEHGSIVIETLYEAPFTSVSHEGIDGVFMPNDVDELFVVLKPFIQQEVSHG